MSVVVYPAVVTASEGALTARFLDLPELTATAASPSDLIRLARERLTVALQQLERAEEPWPQPTSLERAEPPSGGSVLLVDVSVDDTPVRLTISLGERLLRRIDDDAEARSMTRSGYLALGARRLLGEAGAPEPGVAGETGRKLQEEVADLGRRLNEAVGPESPFGRTLAELDAVALDGLRRLRGDVRSALRKRDSRPAADGQDSPSREESDG